MESKDHNKFTNSMVWYKTTLGTSDLIWESCHTGTSGDSSQTKEKDVTVARKYAVKITYVGELDAPVKRKIAKRHKFSKMLHYLINKINAFPIHSVLTFFHLRRNLKNREPENYPKNNSLPELYENRRIKKDQEFDTPKYERIYDQMCAIIESRKLFLDPRLTQTDVIKYVGTNRKYLHIALKSNCPENFKELLNNYRLKLAKSLIDSKVISGKSCVLSEIYSQCGFSTNESFYRIFKKALGITPGQYAEKIEHDFKTFCSGRCNGNSPCPMGRIDSECLLNRKCVDIYQ